MLPEVVSDVLMTLYPLQPAMAARLTNTAHSFTPPSTSPWVPPSTVHQQPVEPEEEQSMTIFLSSVYSEALEVSIVILS